MADLLDIAPSTAVEAVAISGGRSLDVRGLRAPDIAALAVRFPDLLTKLFVGRDNTPIRVFAALGPVIHPIIAAGAGHVGDERAEQMAGALLLEDQIKIVATIYRLSFPNGWAALLEMLASLAPAAADAEKKIAKIRLKKSASASPPSSEPDSRPIMQ